MVTTLNLAANIAQLRKDMGITQDELATHLGVTKASVSKWETGQSFPDIALLPQNRLRQQQAINRIPGPMP